MNTHMMVNALGAGDGPRLGVITGVNGTNPGPASGITYAVLVNEANGTVTYAGVVPSNSRPPDSIDTRGATLNSGVWVYTLAGKTHFLIPEWPDWGTCT